MKTPRFTHFLAAAIGLSLFSNAGCAPKETNARASAQPAAPDSTALAPIATTVAPGIPSVNWTDLKDLGFDARAQFLAGAKALEASVDVQLGELAAKRATMKGNPNVKDWDFAMKEMNDARTYLKSTGQELGKATAETWVQQKEKVGQAWARTQEAYAKVRASTTS